MVWAVPVSLAATQGIAFAFSSSGYLDVSVPRVCLLILYVFKYGYYSITSSGFPHSEISGSKAVCASPKLIAACHVLHRLLMPRHSPCALISLTSSPQTSYLSLPCKHESSIIPLRLLSVQNPLRWAFERFGPRKHLVLL